MNDSHWQQYLYESHSKAWLATWVPTLKYFRFCRAYGGHANDGDELLLAIRIESKRDLELTFGELGIPLVYLPPDNPVPEPGVRYLQEEFKKFRSAIREYPDLEQPGHVEILGKHAFAWVHPGRMEISVSDRENPYEVTPEAIEVVRVIESGLSRLADFVIDPPRDNRNCICPKHYPEFWPTHA